MCGIIGIISSKNVAERIYQGLKRLEYRGYDSAGIATINNGKIERRRAEGKLGKLADLLKKQPLHGNIGIGHTRWATHGAPTTLNAHPHATKEVAVVHNGIIENYAAIKAALKKSGYKFATETDTEVVPNLINYYLDKGDDRITAVKNTLKELEGAFALAIIFKGRDDLLIGARRGSPLAVGYGKAEMMLGSDATALSLYTNKISYLDEGDMVVLAKTGAEFYNAGGAKVKRPVKTVSKAQISSGKGDFPHYMLKEIHEQVNIINNALSPYYNDASGEISLPNMGFKLERIKKITIVACGTSFYAGSVAKYWMEKLARIPVDIDIASEFRYRGAIMEKGGLALFISQSGETADTLAALRYAKKHKQHIISIVNVPESTIARESDVVLYTNAGPEIGVASTKAFTSQLVVLACFTLGLALAKKRLKNQDIRKYIHGISSLSASISKLLKDSSAIKALAKKIYKAKTIIYMGRGVSYPVAMEGALKLKEISYIHAEANAAGELKHGPIALIDKDVPVIVIAPYDDLFEKTASNAEEVAARKGKIILLSEEKGIEKLKKITIGAIKMPISSLFTSPILYAVPVQLLAYYVAALKGCDIDQPRNLAKSVTVE